MHYKNVPLRKVKKSKDQLDNFRLGKPLDIGAASRKRGPDG
jgi:hypothetical protein